MRLNGAELKIARAGVAALLAEERNMIATFPHGEGYNAPTERMKRQLATHERNRDWLFLFLAKIDRSIAREEAARAAR